MQGKLGSMRILLMRHADAGDADPGRWPDDRARPLSPRGEADHRRVALALRRAGVRFDRVLTSPLLRARQTTAITVEVFGWAGTVEVADFLGDRATPEGVVAALAMLAPRSTALCVGHEPTLSLVTALLVAGAPGGARIPVAKSAVVGIDTGVPPVPGRGTLAFVLPPQVLAPLGDG